MPSSHRNGPARTNRNAEKRNGQSRSGQAMLAEKKSKATNKSQGSGKGNVATKKTNPNEVQFLVDLKYNNTLPAVPFEPKFLKFNFPRDRFYKYKEKNSLEQSYQYQIHIEPDIGPPIHLIDPKSAFIPGAKLTAEDRALLRDDDDEGKYAAPFFKRSGADDNVPELKRFVQNAERARIGKSWLLKTQYLDNNLKRTVHNYTSEADNVRRRRAEFEKDLKEHLKQAEKPMKQRILESFDYANSGSLPVHKDKPNLKPVKVFNVLPSLQLCENEYFHVAFDGKNILPDSIKKENGESISKKERTLLYYNRLFTKGNNVALLLPVVKEKLLDDDDDNSEKQFDLQRLREVREFKYSIRNYETNERFAFLWDDEPAKEKEQVKFGSVRFLRLEEAGLEMKRISSVSTAAATGRKRPRKEKQAQEYNLKERELNDEENETRKVRRKDLTEGTYEDSDGENDEDSDRNDKQSPTKTSSKDKSEEVSSDSSSSDSGSDSDSS